MTHSRGKYVIYADGACLGNPGPGGWGVVVAQPDSEYRELCGGPYPHTTNNRMEITAAIEGLRAVEAGADVILRSDSEYVVKTMTLGWKRNANQELWRDLDREVAARHVRFEWVRGHAGDQNNERADQLAAASAKGVAMEPATAPIAPSRIQSELAQIKPLLGPGESIRRCARCGQSFVTEAPERAYCALVACQLQARTRK